MINLNSLPLITNGLPYPTSSTDQSLPLTPSSPQEAEEVVGVTELDIEKAEYYGVPAALSRHNTRPPKELAEIALIIMEAISKRFGRSKTSYYLMKQGPTLFSRIEDPLRRVEFAIRAAKLLSTDEQARWVVAAHELLLRDDIASKCSKGLIIDLALIFAKVAHQENTLMCLKLGQGLYEDFNKAIYILFKQGEFEKGLYLSCQKPQVLLLNERLKDHDQLVEMIVSILKNNDLLKNEKFLQEALAIAKALRDESLILNVLSHLKHYNRALNLLKELQSPISDWLDLSKYFKENSLERKIYIEELLVFAFGRESKDALKIAVKSKALTDDEALQFSFLISCPSDRTDALYDRVLSIQFRKNKTEDDFKNKKIFLKHARVAISQSLITDFQGLNTPYWVSILRDQIQLGLLEDAVETGSSWKQWLNTRGRSVEGMDVLNDIWFLSYWGLFQIVRGQRDEGFEDLAKICRMQAEAKEGMAVIISGNFRSMRYDAANFLYWSTESEIIKKQLLAIKDLTEISEENLRKILFQ